jgi:hypothetical protein
MTERLLIAVYRPYSPLHGGRYTITRVLSRIEMHNQYFIGRVKETTYGFAYDMREKAPQNYEHVGYPITDTDIEAIKRGIAWHKAHPDTNASSVVWVEGITS